MTAPLAGTEHQPRARLSLEAALRDDSALAHAYLFHGPPGTGKRKVARSFAASLIAQGSPDPADTHRRVLGGSHPDLTWIEPRGAHEILVDDVRSGVVAQAALRPFEAERRVFVIVEADRMNDQSQNALLKTLEEPASFAVFVLVSSAPGRLLPTIPSRCRQLRFGPLPSTDIADTLTGEGIEPATALACARLAGGDAERARALAGPLAGQRAEAEAALRATLADSDDASWPLSAPWRPLLDRAEQAGDEAEAAVADEAERVLASQPKRGRSGLKTEWERQARRASRRARTASLDLSLELTQAWLRDLLAVASGAEAQVFNSDRLSELRADARDRDGASLIEAMTLVQATRRHMERNVLEDLALEALFDGLRRLGA